MRIGRVFREPIEALEPRRLLSIQPVGPEFRVNSFTSNNQHEPSVGIDADGDFVIVWQSLGPLGSSFDIYAQRYSAAGVPQGPTFLVNTYTTFNQVSPSVAMDPNGNFVVAWKSAVQDGDAYGIYAQRYSATGVVQGAEFRVNIYTTSSQDAPVVARDNVGDFVIAWESLSQDGSPFTPGVYARRYNSAGVPQGGEFAVNTYTTGSQAAPSVAMDADGDFVIAWGSYAQDGSSGGVYAQRYNALGVPQASEFRVNSYTTGNQRAPAVAIKPDGSFVIAWQTEGQDGSFDGIYAQRYSAAGAVQGTEFRVNSYTTNSQATPSAAIDTNGGFVIAWDSFLQDGSSSGVYAQRYDGAGVADGAEFRVNTYTTDNQLRCSVAIDADGDVVIAWRSDGQDGSGYGVYAQRYAVIPSVTASAFLFNIAPHWLRFGFDENVSGSLGTDDLIVQNLTTSQTIPSSDFSLSYDLTTNTATFTYTGSAGAQTGVLPEGSYRATLLASGISTPNGMHLPADYLFNFFFKRGDANHDGAVNLQDFNILAANFGRSPRTFSQGDFNYDTIVNLNDFNILASRFGTSLSPEMFSSGTIGRPRNATRLIDGLVA